MGDGEGRPAGLKYSIFSVQDHHPTGPRSLTRFYGEVMEQIELADRLGYYAFYVAEHHFHEYGVFPNPAVALAHAAARTKRIRLGTGVSVLPFRNPMTVAEDYAMLDQLSGGRVELGVGSGYLSHEFEGFGVDGKHKREAFDDALRVLKLAFSGEKVTFEGPFHKVDDIAVNVTPIQTPHPPIYVAVLRKEAAYFVGKQGNKLMTVPYAAVDAFEEIGEMMAEYARGFTESGGSPDEVDNVMALHTYVAESDEAARAEAADAFDLYVATRLYAKSQVYDDIMASGVSLIGGSETVTDKLVQLYEMGARNVAFLMNFGALDHELVCASMERMQTRVIPEVERRLAAKSKAA